MRLIELNLAGFGCLVERKFNFHPAANVIFGANETGKSTLQQAILAMLYGFDDAAQSAEKNGAERFRPWYAQAYSGSLQFQLDDGAIFILNRSFSQDGSHPRLIEAKSGDEIKFRQRLRSGTTDFIERHLGMSRPVFVASAFVREGALHEAMNREAATVSDAILRLLDSAAAETSAEHALERVDRALLSLGSERSHGALLAKARERVEDLHETRALRLATQQTVQHDLERVELLSLEIDELQGQVTALDRQLLEIQIEILRRRMQRWSDSERNRSLADEEITELTAIENFPTNKKEDFFRYRDEYLHLEKLQVRLSDERTTLDVRLMAHNEKNRITHVPEKYWEEHSFEDFFALHQRWNSTFEAILNNANASHDADVALKQAGMSDDVRKMVANLEWQQLESHKALETEVKAEQEEVDKIRNEYDDFKQMTLYRRRILVFVAIISAISFIYSLASLGSSGAGFWLEFLLALSLISLVYCITLNASWINRTRELSTNLIETEERHMDNRHKLRDTLHEFHVDSIGELVQRRLRFVELGAAEQTGQQLQRELQKIEQSLDPWMKSLGIGHIAPETLQDAEKRLRESHQIWSDKAAIKNRLAEIERQQQEISWNRGKVEGQLEQILQAAGIEEPVGERAFQAYLTGCQKREYLDNIRIQKQQAEILSNEILEGETLESIQDRVTQLEAELAALPSAPISHQLAGMEPTEGTLASLRSSRDHVLQEILRNKQMLSAVKERVATRLSGLPQLAEIEEEIAQVEHEISRYERARQALEIARETIANAAQRMHRDFAPKLNEFVSRHLSQLTGGLYTGALVDPTDFSVRILSRGSSTPIELSKLSYGAIEQVYLLLRAAIANLFSRSGESVPLFLDDPLVHADDKRKAGALGILQALADKHQIFYFTKDGEVAKHFQERYGAEAVIRM